jgi:hypothetical protein
MQVNKPTQSQTGGVHRSMSGDESASSAQMYSPNARERAAVYAAARRYQSHSNSNASTGNSNFAEPLSDFDKYLINGFENDDENVNDVSNIHNYNNISFDSTADGTFELHRYDDFLFTPNSVDASHRTHIEFEEDSYGQDSQHHATEESYDHDAAAAASSLEEFEYEGYIWNTYQTEEGYYYYLHSLTYHSQWYDPREYGLIHEEASTSYDAHSYGEGYEADHTAVPEYQGSDPDADAVANAAATPSHSPSKAKGKRFSPARTTVALNRTDKLYAVSSSDSEDDAAGTSKTPAIRTNRNNRISISGSGSIISAERVGIRPAQQPALFSRPNANPAATSTMNDAEKGEEAEHSNPDFDADYADECHVNSDWDKATTPKGTTSAAAIKKLHEQYKKHQQQQSEQAGASSGLKENEPARSTADHATTAKPLSQLRPPPISIENSADGHGQRVSEMPMCEPSEQEQQLLSKYIRMKNIGIPIESICTQMRNESLDESLIAKFQATTVKSATPRRVLNKKEKLSPALRSTASNVPASSGNSAVANHFVVSSADESDSAPRSGVTRSVVIQGFKVNEPTPSANGWSENSNAGVPVTGDGAKPLTPGAARPRVWDSPSPIAAPAATENVFASANNSPKPQHKTVVVDETDRDQLHKLFGRTASTESLLSNVSIKVSSAAASGKARPEDSTCLVIDKKRAQAIVVGLLAFKTVGSPANICMGICSLDNLNGCLRLDNLESLLTLMPTSKEIARINEMKTSTHPAEQFMVVASEYSCLTQRLRCFITIESYPVRSKGVITASRNLANVCTKVRSNFCF